MEMTVPMEVLDADDGTGMGSMYTLPAISTPLDVLFGEHASKRKKIYELAELVRDNTVLGYFLEGARKRSRDLAPPLPGAIFDPEQAMASLNAEYWLKAINLTGVLKVMPAVKRSEWNKQIYEMETPAFEEDSVRATIIDLLNSRSRLFAERVDAIFRALSSDHVTNVPEGFGRRMIIAHLTDSFGYTDYRRIEVIHDLRVVIATFTGAQELSNGATESAIRPLARDGQWNLFDGGSLRIRLYKRGTAHLEIHPELVWRLNNVLASLYPAAIPSQFRTKPPKRHKEYILRDDVISQRVCDELQKVLERLRYGDKKTVFLSEVKLDWVLEVQHILTVIGGVELKPKVWTFDYEPHEVLREVIRMALLPDRRSHQFYPTPDGLAREMVDMAKIEDGHTVLEPQCGSMAIARHLPVDRTQCVEISKLHCEVAKSMGYRVENTDFLAWNPDCLFDRIVMNPPFSAGRAQAHVKKASELLAVKGRIVAVVPAGMKDTIVAPGMKHTCGPLRSNEFKDASVTVTILTIDRT